LELGGSPDGLNIFATTHPSNNCIMRPEHKNIIGTTLNPLNFAGIISHRRGAERRRGAQENQNQKTK